MREEERAFSASFGRKPYDAATAAHSTPGDRPPTVPAISRCRTRQHHGLALTVALLAAAKDDTRLGAYVILSFTTGIRTEETRALRRDHMDGQPDTRPPVPPHVAVWRSVGCTVTPRRKVPADSSFAAERGGHAARASEAAG